MAIHFYASAGDCAEVRNELARGVAVDARDEEDYTPLARAVSSAKADEEMVRLLIASGADVNAVVGDRKRAVLGLAACSGDAQKVELLLNAGADIKFKSPGGYTALVHVMHCLHDSDRLVPMAEILIESGAELDHASEYGESPLSVASFLGRFDAVKALLDAGADPSPLRWTELLQAVALGDGDEAQRLLEKGGKLDDRDRWERTPLLIAAFVGDMEKVKWLHSAGAGLNEQARGGETALMVCVSKGHAELLQWLLDEGADMEAVDFAGNTALMLAAQAGAAACAQRLLAAGADPRRVNHYEENAMAMASNEAVIRLLMEAGEDLGDISREMRRTLAGLRGGDTLSVSKAEYRSGRRPQFGRSNPEAMDIPFWREMVRAGISAYQARSQFGDTDSLDQPVWCFSRFGASFTELPDGRFVQIGGEHEDFYDPDFCIYNDVVIHERGGGFQILGYPPEVFPPTDFHSATYVNGHIYLIGRLGYHGTRRFGATPICRLDCTTWKMEAVESSGESPGWIYKHKAAFTDSGILVSGGKVCVEIAGQEEHRENESRFRLDLSNMRWTRV